MKNSVSILMALCFMLCVSPLSWAGTKAKPFIQQTKMKKKTVLTPRVPKGLPDLVVTITASHVQKPGKAIPNCKVVVRNIGKGVARGTKTAGSKGYMIDLTLSSDGHLPVSFAGYSNSFSDDVLLKGGRISNTPDLKPNQSKVFYLNNILVIPADTPAGKYCLGGIVDPGRVVHESNENNNTICLKLSVKGKDKPDLIVSNLKVVKDCWIEVTIKNIGSAGLPGWVYSGAATTNAGIQMHMDGTPWGGMAIKMFDPRGILKTPGGAVTKLWFKGSAGIQLSPGFHYVKVVADVHKKINESNEQNNTMVKRLQCRETQSQKPLQVINLIHSQNYQLVDNRIRITVKFNKDVLKTTVIGRSTLRVKTEKDPNAMGTIVWLNKRTLVWTSARDFHDLCTFDSDCFFDLTITDSVKDTSGQKLDGDKNGAPGGNLHHNFTILG